MTLAVFGGSFNPPHLAHVMACAYVLSCSEADHIVMIPCARHAFDKPLAPFPHRVAMCRLAVEGVLERVEVSAMEGERPGVSYMVDTLEELARQRPGDRLVLTMGSDVAGETRQWKNFDRIRALADIFVIPRLGSATYAEAARSERFVLPDLSSEAIRARLAQGDLPREALPVKVADYIAAHGLYGYPRA